VPCANASSSALVVKVVTVFYLLARQLITPLNSFVTYACKLRQLTVLLVNEALVQVLKVSPPLSLSA